MPAWLDKITGRDRAEIRDAKRLYGVLMTQSRRPVFFGEGRVPDSYDGRIDLLTLHMSLVMRRLNDFAEQGERLSQALYDVMIDDFDSALREEALADSAVKRRIKPIAQLFFTRAKTYTDALDANEKTLRHLFDAGPISDANPKFKRALTVYTADFANTLAGRGLGDIALADFAFPDLEDA